MWCSTCTIAKWNTGWRHYKSDGSWLCTSCNAATLHAQQLKQRCQDYRKGQPGIFEPRWLNDRNRMPKGGAAEAEPNAQGAANTAASSADGAVRK